MTEKNDKPESAALMLRIDADLKRRFKTTCAEKNVSMQTTIIALIATWLAGKK